MKILIGFGVFGGLLVAWRFLGDRFAGVRNLTGL